MHTKIIDGTMGIRRNFSRGGQTRHFAYPFHFADDAMQMHVHKTLYPFYTITKMCPCYGSSRKSPLRWRSNASFSFMLLFTLHSKKVRSLPLQYQQSLSRSIFCQRCLRSTVTCGKTPTTVTWNEPLKISLLRNNNMATNLQRFISS